MRKIFIATLLFGVMYQISYAQIGGLSAGKLRTFGTATVPVNAIEFEPSLGICMYKSAFSQHGDLYPAFDNKDSLSFENQLAFRFSYGLFKNAEIGVLVPQDVSALQTGIKYKIFAHNKSSFGLMGGLNLAFNNRIHKDEIMAYSSGLIYSFDGNFLLDMNAQMQRSITSDNANSHNHYYFSADAGYYLKNNIQLVSGLYFHQNKYPSAEDNQQSLTFMPGITIEKAENFILVLNYSCDIFGKNIQQAHGLGIALIIMID